MLFPVLYLSSYEGFENRCGGFVRLLPRDLFRWAKIQGPGWTDSYTGRFEAMFHAGTAKVAFGHFPIFGKFGGSERAGQFTTVASDTEVPIDIDHPPLVPFENGPGRANHHARCITAVQA